MTISTRQKGFTIVETLVAVAILVTAVIGTTSAVQSAISSYLFSKDQITAFYLAQEAFEQIRNIRDENHLNNRNWLTGLAETGSDPCYFGQPCRVDVLNRTTSPAACSGTCSLLRQEVATGFFSYDPLWPETNFRRTIVLSSINPNEIAVTVTVNWGKGVVSRQFKARENLLNWQ